MDVGNVNDVNELVSGSGPPKKNMHCILNEG